MACTVDALQVFVTAWNIITSPSATPSKILKKLKTTWEAQDDAKGCFDFKLYAYENLTPFCKRFGLHNFFDETI